MRHFGLVIWLLMCVVVLGYAYSVHGHRTRCEAKGGLYESLSNLCVGKNAIIPMDR